MQTAANFAACEQPGNDVAALIQNVRLLIDVKTAHRVVNGRSNMNRIVGSLIQFAFHARLSAEFRVLFLFDGLIPLFKRLLQIIFLDVKFFGKLFQSSGLNDQTLFLIKINGFDAFFDLRIKHQISTLFFKSSDCVRNDAARGQFIDEPFAVSVDQNGAFSAHCLTDQISVIRILLNGRMHLNQVHLHDLRSNLFRKLDSVARSSGVVRGSVCLKIRTILGNQVF